MDHVGAIRGDLRRHRGSPDGSITGGAPGSKPSDEFTRIERVAYSLNLRPWEVDRMTPGELVAWIGAHVPEPTMSREEKVSILFQRIGWQ